MNQPRSNAVLITGANAGLGKDVARQLAILGKFGTIYLACRNKAKAEAAMTDLERITVKSVFDIVLVDTTDLTSVRSAVAAITQPLDAIVLNAGGTGGQTPLALTADGVTTMFAANVLGHVVLLEQLIVRGMLTSTAVLTGSEAARGVPILRIKRPIFETHSVDEFATVIDGSFFRGRKFDPSLAYAQVKYLGALWMSALARKHPDLRLLTVSPGNTSGTDVFRDLSVVPRTLLQRIVMPYVAPAFGIAHKLDVGAKRLVDGVNDESWESGVFYASAPKTLTGPLMDQARIVSDFGSETIQDRAYDAIHRFVPASAPETFPRDR
jgi:NAD(P)-dependent dehydrogenase (short-subunit alcohol dehydrogenase family)